MKLIRTNWAMWALGALLVAACSSGSSKSGGAPATVNALTITTTDAAGTTTTFTADDSNSVISAYKNAVENKTIVQVCSDIDKDDDCSQLVIMTIDGTTAQSYSMNTTNALTQIVYHDDETETGVLSHYVSSDGSIDVSESGTAAGSKVKGSFASTLTCNSGCAGNLALSGTFSVALSQ